VPDRENAAESSALRRRAAGAGAELFPLLRGSHLLASAVRELGTIVPSSGGGVRLSASQIHLLRVISLDGRHPVGQVARLLGISTPAATKTIDRLERLGLVERHAHEGDRRTRLFSVSAAGRALVRRNERRAAARMRAALRDLAPAEADAFPRLLARFSYALLTAAPAPRGSCLRCAAYLDTACPLARSRGGCPCDDFLRWTPAGSAGRSAGAR